MLSDAPRSITSDPPRQRACRRCGVVAVADENQCRSCKSFLPGSAVRLISGARRRHPVDPETLPLFVEYARDLGGVDELTAGERSVLRRMAEADAVCQTAFDYLTRSAENIPAPKVQRALAALAAHAPLVFKGAALLGLKRRPKAPPSLAEALDAARARREAREREAREAAEAEADDERTVEEGAEAAAP